MPESQETPVTFSLRTTLEVHEPLEMDPLGEIAADPYLARLDISERLLRGDKSIQVVTADFFFLSVADYRAWRESERVVSLLSGFAESGGRVETALNVLRRNVERALGEG